MSRRSAALIKQRFLSGRGLQPLSISDIFHQRASLLTLSHKIQMWLDERSLKASRVLLTSRRESPVFKV